MKKFIYTLLACICISASSNMFAVEEQVEEQNKETSQNSAFARSHCKCKKFHPKRAYKKCKKNCPYHFHCKGNH